MHSGSTNVTPKEKLIRTTPFQKKIEGLKKQLEKATWEKNPSEDEIEEKRLETLYAHARMLRRIAAGVNDFFSNHFGKTDNWANTFNSIVHAKVGEQAGSSNGSSSLYGEDSKSKICIEQSSNESSNESGDLSDDILKKSASKPDNEDYIKEVDSHYEVTTVNSPGYKGNFSPARLQK